MPWSIADTPVSFVGRETLPTLTRGDEITLPLIFRRESERQLIQPRDSRYGIQYSFNYEGPDARLPYRAHYEAILAYLDYAGESIVRYGRTDRGEPWYRERLPANAPVESLVVPIEAPDDSDADRSLWGIIVDGEDQSDPVADLYRIDLSVVVLAPRSAFDDRAAVAAAFEDALSV